MFLYGQNVFAIELSNRISIYEKMLTENFTDRSHFRDPFGSRLGTYQTTPKYRLNVQSSGKVIYSSWVPRMCQISQQFFPSSLMHNGTLQPLHMNAVLRRSAAAPDLV